MRTLKAIFFGIQKGKSFYYTRALERVKVGVLNRKDQQEIEARQLFNTKAQVYGVPISMVVAYYIPIPPFFFPIFWKFCALVLCYRSITIPIFLRNRDFYVQIADKYDLTNKPDLLDPPKRKIYKADYMLDKGSERYNETINEYVERIENLDKRLREAYELNKRYKKSLNYESFEAYKNRKLSEEQIKAANKK